MTDATDEIPRSSAMVWPTIVAIREAGGSANRPEINSSVCEQLGITEAQMAITVPSGASKISHYLDHARSRLKAAGLANNSVRGVWALTEAGRAASEGQVSQGIQYESDNYIPTPIERIIMAADGDSSELTFTDAPGIVPDSDWREVLLESLRSMSPDGFERLSQRLLREAGFSDVTVTGKSGDGGIDGTGIYKISLISFQTYFQCKRYSSSNTVGSAEIRNFRGALRGAGDKGLFITTSRFTSSASEEAKRSGAEPIDLINGDGLCDLLKEYRLGVAVSHRQVEDVEVKAEFFQDI